MSARTPCQATKVSFPNQFTIMAGHLFVPANFDKTKKYPALPWQFLWWRQRANRRHLREKDGREGYVTPAFNASHQG